MHAELYHSQCQSMGLDLELFESPVDPDLICVACQKVVVDPVSNSCHHVFCQSCITKRRKFSRSRYCPDCSAHLDGETSDVSLEVKLKLLELRIQCSYGCGTDYPLAELPEHVSDVCPNAPVPCPNKDEGCNKSIQRRDVALHEEECYYRMANCEACDFRVKYCDLFTHQRKTRCLEMKLRQQVVRATKSTNMEVRRHRDYVLRQHLALERHQRLAVLEHAKSKETRKVHGMKSRRECNGSEDVDVFSDTRESCQAPTARGNVDTTASRNGVSRSSVGSGLGVTVRTCKNCKKPFREASNHHKACSYHEGTCYSCGRMDYTHGCKLDQHVA